MSLTGDLEGDVEVISKQEFFDDILKDGMGLKRFVDIPEEASKLQKTLVKIGAIAQPEVGSDVELVRLEVLMAAMRIHGYEFSSTSSQLEGFDLRELTPKSIRILNRLARILATYQDKY